MHNVHGGTSWLKSEPGQPDLGSVCTTRISSPTYTFKQDSILRPISNRPLAGETGGECNAFKPAFTNSSERGNSPNEHNILHHGSSAAFPVCAAPGATAPDSDPSGLQSDPGEGSGPGENRQPREFQSGGGD